MRMRRQGTLTANWIISPPAGRWSTRRHRPRYGVSVITARRCRSDHRAKAWPTAATDWIPRPFHDIRHDIPRRSTATMRRPDASAAWSSQETQLLSKGNVSHSAGGGERINLGVELGAFTSPMLTPRMIRRRAFAASWCDARETTLEDSPTVAIRCGLPGPDDGRDNHHPRPAPAQHPGHAGRSRCSR